MKRRQGSSEAEPPPGALPRNRGLERPGSTLDQAAALGPRDMLELALLEAVVAMLRGDTAGGVVLIIGGDAPAVMDIGDVPRRSAEAHGNPMYRPLDGSTPIDVASLIRKFGVSKNELMRRVYAQTLRMIARIERDAKFVPHDHDVEFIRSAVFVLEASGISEEEFCEMGRDIIGSIRKIIAQYEERKGFKPNSSTQR